MKPRVANSEYFTIGLLDSINNIREAWAMDIAKIMAIVTIFQSSLSATNPQIVRRVTKIPKTETIMPIKARLAYFFLSNIMELLKPVKLYSPIVRVVAIILNSISPKSPIKKITIATKALIDKDTIKLIRKTLLKLIFADGGLELYIGLSSPIN